MLYLSPWLKGQMGTGSWECNPRLPGTRLTPFITTEVRENHCGSEVNSSIQSLQLCSSAHGNSRNKNLWPVSSFQLKDWGPVSSGRKLLLTI
ncbi:hypothetical protein LEMLEM_LOCUS21672 [Lemmus lemmus]